MSVDLNSGNAIFLQLAERIEAGELHVTDMQVDTDPMYDQEFTLSGKMLYIPKPATKVTVKAKIRERGTSAPTQTEEPSTVNISPRAFRELDLG